MYGLRPVPFTRRAQAACGRRLCAAAGDVGVFDFVGFFDGVAGEVVGVPGDGFAGDFGVAAEVLEGVDGGGWVVFLVGEAGGFPGGFVFDAESAVEDGEVVVGGEVVGVNALQALVDFAGLGVVVLLVVAEAEFAEGVAGARVGDEDGFQVVDGFLDLAAVALDQGAVVEGAGVVGEEGEGFGEVGAGFVVLFPEDFDDGHVGEGVGVVGTEGGDALEGVDTGRVLLAVEEADAVVVPAHPFGIFVGGGRDGCVEAEVEGA